MSSIKPGRRSWRRPLTVNGQGNAAGVRETEAEERGDAADERGIVAAERASASNERALASAKRGSATDERQSRADERESAADQRESRADERESAADQRESTATERDSAAHQRELGYARSLLASAPDAMVIFNADGLIQLANAETVELFGYARDELIGRHVDILLPFRFAGPIWARRRTSPRPRTLVRLVSALTYGAAGRTAASLPSTYVSASLKPTRAC